VVPLVSRFEIRNWRSCYETYRCVAKHAGTGAACAKKCIEGGSKPVFVTEAKKEVWAIDNPDAVKDAYGKHVALTVTPDEAAKTVHVTSVSVLAD